VIVAANVLHATANIDETLRNVHTLLAPGGLVFLLEKTEPEWWIDLTFGLLDGWWRFRDFNRRPDYPLLDSATWTAALEEAGFEETAATEGPQGALIIAGMPAKTRLKRWLVQSDDDGLRNALKARLEARGAICQVACDAVADGVIFIAPRNLAGSPATTATGLFAHALDLSRTAQRLWIVTHGVHEGKSDGAVAQAALWGFARTFALEQPGRWGAIVDLDPSEPFETQAEELAAELFNTGDEDQVMLRGGERRVARLARQHSVPAAPFRCRAGASYLVTGGLGGIGLVLAKWLIGRGARHLCLVGRTVLPPRDEWDRVSDAESRRRIEGIRAIEQAGATVDVVSADVADHEQMHDVLRRFGGQLPPLGGVVHAAAHFRYDELDAMDPSALRSVLHPKAAGAWNLHELTRDLPLEFFVMSSSTASVIGSRGLAHYAAANQFLDALAIRRHTLGLPATSVVWGTWNEMRGATVEERERYLRSGLRPMNSTAALDALGDAIASGEPVRMVADIDWSLLKPAWEARRRRPLLELLGSGGRIQRETPTAGGKPPGKDTAKARALAGMTAQARERFCMDLVSAGVAQVLGLGPSETLDPDTGFFDLGMDSLMSQELRRRLEEGAGCSLPASAVFNYPNARALARFLAREESPVNTPPAVPIVIATDFVSEKPASEESLDDLSEEDLERELAQRLQTLR
jgi:NAD(P)-dependent dehydrogenase (short-subunit alcohol dehydrogenase family)/acyl carrier protein